MLRGWFQEDDFDIIYRVSAHGPFGIWTFGPTNFFRPVISLLFWLQYRVWGLDPLPYRVLNDVLHAGVATAASLTLFELLNRRHRLLCVAAGALFLFHPSHVEAVNWIAARTDLCGTLFGALSLLAFLRWQRSGRTAILVTSLLLFGVGMLCKESVVLVPLIAAAFAWKRSERRLVGPAVGFVAVGFGYGVLRFALMGPALKGNLERSTGLKLVGATAAQVTRTFFPGLPFGDPGLNNAQVVKTLPGIAFLLAGVAVAISVFLLARRQSDAPTGRLIVAYGLAMAPALGLSMRLFRSQGERFVYFPSFFAMMLLALALQSVCTNRRLFAGAIVGCCALGLTCIQWQNYFWRQGSALSQRVQASFIRDVVGASPASRIELLNVPASVQGAYGVAYVFESVAPLFKPGRHPSVDVRSVMRLNQPDHSVSAVTDGNIVTMVSSPSDAVFNLEDTFVGHAPASEELESRGYRDFEPHRLELDLSALPAGAPAYFWNGNRFLPVPGLVARWD